MSYGRDDSGRVWDDTMRWKQIYQFIRPYRVAFLNLFACVILTSFIGMLYPYIFALLIDEVFYRQNLDFFKIIVMSYGAIYVGEMGLHLILNSIWAYLTTRFLFDIRRKVFETIFRLKAHFLSGAQSGELIARIDQDAGEFMNLIHWNIFYVTGNLIRLGMALVMVALINFKLLLLMVVVVPVSVYVAMYFGKVVKPYLRKQREQYGGMISWVFEILNGMREIQLLAGERNVTRQFVHMTAGWVRTRVKTSYVELASERANALISLLSDLSLYALSGVLIIRGELTVGGFIAVMDYFSKGNGLLKNLNEANMRIQNNMVSINKVLAILNEETEGENTNLPNLTISKGEIAFHGVSFGYTPERSVVKGMNLTIHAGEKLSLVGVSGAGKSTMASLLVRYYDPDAGYITLDGQNIREVSLKSVRRAVGLVQQDALLFRGTIRYNLRLGNPRCSEREMWEACERAYIAEFIRTLPQGLDTVVGMDGVALSGGQKQRIAIARILLKNPKIIIFDEATSALDFEAEKSIQQAWRELSVGRTSIIIAHRLSTILDSDRVAVLHDGVIVACDHHLRLLETNEYYRRLFEEQYMQQEESA